MLTENAERLGIADMGDLARQGKNLIFGANREYFMRSWAYPHLRSLGIEFKGVKEVDSNDRLSGLLNKNFDVGVIVDTDRETIDGRYRRTRWE